MGKNMKKTVIHLDQELQDLLDQIPEAKDLIDLSHLWKSYEDNQIIKDKIYILYGIKNFSTYQVKKFKEILSLPREGSNIYIGPRKYWNFLGNHNLCCCMSDTGDKCHYQIEQHLIEYFRMKFSKGEKC